MELWKLVWIYSSFLITPHFTSNLNTGSTKIQRKSNYDRVTSFRLVPYTIWVCWVEGTSGATLYQVNLTFLYIYLCFYFITCSNLDGDEYHESVNCSSNLGHMTFHGWVFRKIWGKLGMVVVAGAPKLSKTKVKRNSIVKTHIT